MCIRDRPLTKEYFMWFTLLSVGVFGFFVSTDLFTMFMFYEVAPVSYTHLIHPAPKNNNALNMACVNRWNMDAM